MKKGTLKKVLRYAGKYRILIAISMILAIVTALLSLYVPILAGRAVDQLLGKGNVNFERLMSMVHTACRRPRRLTETACLPLATARP